MLNLLITWEHVRKALKVELACTVFCQKTIVNDKILLQKKNTELGAHLPIAGYIT